MTKITIDSRETLLCNHFRRVPGATIESLDVGDVLIETESPLAADSIVIERKTLPDLAASIRDGRHREQKARLMALYPHNRIMFLIEGDLGTDLEHVVGHVPKSTLLSSMLNTMFRDGISLIRTISIPETIWVIESVASKLAKGDFSLSLERPSSLSVTAKYCTTLKSKKIDNNTPSVCFLRQLTLIPGISMPMADAICVDHPTMSSLVTILSNYDNVATIAEIKYGDRARRIGPKAAEKTL